MQQDKLYYKAILGLGNPGTKYKKTRHNIGNLFVDFSLDQKKLKLIEDRFISFSKIDNSLILAKSKVFMNESVIAFRYLKEKFNLKTKEILVVHDDSDLLFGKIKLSFAKNSAGHKGIESIISLEKTNNFWRLRLGIRPKDLIGPKRIKAEKFVLKNFTAQEYKDLEAVFKKAIELIKKPA